MREILFHGKTKETGEWVEGFYTRLYDCKGNYSHRIYTGYAETDCGDFYPEVFEVIPETVGQFTGWTDKNNKKIFEGDILKFSDRLVVVFWNTHIGYWDSYFLKFTDRSNDREDMSSYTWKYKSEVVGNIHDNPELLKGGA